MAASVETMLRRDDRHRDHHRSGDHDTPLLRDVR
jgi:hypothetical protein